MANRLELKLKELNPGLYGKLQETVKEVELLLQQYSKNFPEYTDHSKNHTEQVFNYAAHLLSDEEIVNLNEDEIYVLSMACYLHDIGMCIPEDKIEEIAKTEGILEYRESHKEKSTADFIRDIHHELSYKFIMHEQKLLKIKDVKYAKAIGLVAQGHRKVALDNIDEYNPKFSVKDGKDFVCLPYLAAIIRLADELDITNIRTPKLLTKYYMPNNEKSIHEWEKHIATTTVNLFDGDNEIKFQVECTDQKVHSALKQQFDKIEETILYCQKIIKNISNTGRRTFSLGYDRLDVKYDFKGFDLKGIKFSFNVNNVIETFIGKDLYENKMAALREAIQNAIDTCRYKKVITEGNYSPKIEITIEDNSIEISDNGLGMDEFIIENYFGKLANSYYQEDKVKSEYEAIGQFGIGVFSYFLIAEYIDIETKTENSDALKFRIDADPNSYFHFFDKASRNEAGTSIELNFKKDEKINADEILAYIQNTFRYIEFDIEISHKDVMVMIEKQSFDSNISSYIKNRISIENEHLVSQIKYFRYDYNNEEYEGSIYFLYGANFKTFNFKYLLQARDQSSPVGGNLGRLEVSQKGVFVDNISHYGVVENCFGKMNIKRKLEIKLNRQGFSDSNEIFEIFQRISKEMVYDFFNKLILIQPKDSLPKITYNFFSESRGVDIYEDLLYIDVYVNNKKNIMTLEDFEQKFEVFKIMLFSTVPDKYKNEVILNIRKSDSLYGEDFQFSFFRQIFIENYQCTSEFSGDTTILHFQKNYQKDENSEIAKRIFRNNYQYYFEYFPNESLLGISKYEDILNYKHKFFKKLFEKEKKIFGDDRIKQILTETMDTLLSYISALDTREEDYSKEYAERRFKVLLQLISKLNKELGTNLKITKKDFEI